MSHRHARRFQWSLWGAPIGLALVSALGLVAGLLGDGVWDVVSWLGLGLPIAACLWFGLVRK
jgi:hypothetical protein